MTTKNDKSNRLDKGAINVLWLYMEMNWTRLSINLKQDLFDDELCWNEFDLRLISSVIDWQMIK